MDMMIWNPVQLGYATLQEVETQWSMDDIWKGFVMMQMSTEAQVRAQKGH